MRSARKRVGVYLAAWVSLLLIATAVFAGLAIETHREEHGHGDAGRPCAQGGELQVGVAGVHGLNSSGRTGVSA